MFVLFVTATLLPHNTKTRDPGLQFLLRFLIG